MPTITKTVTLEETTDINVDEDDFELTDLIDMLENKMTYINMSNHHGELERLKEIIDDKLGEKEEKYLEDQMKKEFLDRIFDKYTIWELEKMIPA